MSQMFNPRAQRGIMAVRADASPAAIIASLQGAFSEYKAKVDEELVGLKKGQSDVVRTEEISRIDASVSALQKAADDAAMKVSALMLGAGDGKGKAPVDAEYTTAFRAHFTKGEVQASLNKGTDGNGGYLAPVEWDRTITDKLIRISPMRQIAAVQTISTAGFKKLFNARGMGSGWVGETAARPETSTPTLGQMTYTPGEIYANPAATQQLLDDAEVNLEEWIAGEVETEFSYQEGLAFIAGNGVNKPNGFLSYVTGGVNAAAHPWGAIPTGRVTASATVITTDELIDLVYSLPGELAGEARFVLNRNVLSAVRKLKDGQGNYIWQPSYQAGQPSSLMMYPVTEMPAMPDIATGAFPIAFGDFRRGYLIVDRTGVRVLRDPYTNKPFVHFYTTKRVGGGLLNPEPLRVLRMA